MGSCQGELCSGCVECDLNLVPESIVWAKALGLLDQQGMNSEATWQAAAKTASSMVPRSSSFEVEVKSKANPTASVLRQVRVVLQRPEVAELFKSTPMEALPGKLLTHLQKAFTEYGYHTEVLQDAVTYILDEFVQIGDSVLLISPHTGRAIARLTEEDIYQPQAVPRDYGGMAVPAKRLRPELEGFLVHYSFERVREQDDLGRISLRIPHTTDLVRDLGDPRLLFTTLNGRREIRHQIAEVLPNLLNEVKVRTRLSPAIQLLSRFLPPSDQELLRGPDFTVEVGSRYRTPLVDATARNLHFDVKRVVLDSTVTSWARELATNILARLGPDSSHNMTEWVGSPDHTNIMFVMSPNTEKHLSPDRPTLVVNQFLDGVVLGVEGTYLGALRVQDTGINTKEVHDRWTATTYAKVDVWLDTSRFAVFDIKDVPVSGVTIEG